MKIAIIGAGAAGMMAMATLIESGIPGEDILLFDGNDRMGRKVALTGGGRCNVTTAITKRKELLPKYIRGNDFLESAFGAFSPKKCREWFEMRGVPLKEEDNYRLFPVSDDGWDIVRVFERIAEENHASLHLGEKVESVSAAWEKFRIQTKIDTYETDICIVTTGGNAYAKTGSTGDGYSIARYFWHTITPLWPSLSSFLTKESWGSEISGLVLPNAELRAISQSDAKIAVNWWFLFTHFGISWPVTFALSAHLAFDRVTPSNPAPITINADATRNRESWEKDLIQAFSEHPTKSVRNILPFFVPRRYAETLAAFSSIGDKTATTVSREDRKKLVDLLFSMPLSLTERRPGDEFVTAWGVSCDEIDPKTMQSKLTKNLYFAWELLNIDAVTGGFNLQGCWATGYVAGRAVWEQT